MRSVGPQQRVHSGMVDADVANHAFQQRRVQAQRSSLWRSNDGTQLFEVTRQNDESPRLRRADWN